MYMPFYAFAAPTKSMQSTQKIMRTIKSTRIFSLFVTVITVLCDLSQIRYFSDLTLNDSFFASMGVSLVVVLGLDALCFLPWWASFLIVLVLTVVAALLLPSRHSVCWARMLSTFCLLPVMIKSLGFELLAVSLPTAILNIGFCLLLSYLTAPVLLELIFVSYLYQK